jgi:hypothetical protein
MCMAPAVQWYPVYGEIFEERALIRTRTRTRTRTGTRTRTRTRTGTGTRTRTRTLFLTLTLTLTLALTLFEERATDASAASVRRVLKVRV